MREGTQERLAADFAAATGPGLRVRSAFVVGDLEEFYEICDEAAALMYSNPDHVRLERCEVSAGQRLVVASITLTPVLVHNILTGEEWAE